MFDRVSLLAALCVSSSYTRIVKGKKDSEQQAHIPVSLILVAPPQSGKTTLIERFKANRGMHWVDDMTMTYALKLARMAKSGECLHVLFPELQRLALRKDHTAEQTFSALSAMMWDGQRRVALGNDEYNFDGARLGVIGAVTPLALKNHEMLFRQHGLFSRALWIDFTLPIGERMAIIENILSGDAVVPPIDLPAVSEPIPVSFSATVGDAILRAIPSTFAGHMRFALIYRSLVASAAFMTGEDVARIEHIEVVRETVGMLLDDCKTD